VHALLVDASASMRGVREVFARGLGLALAKKLQLVGVEVWFSFFDSRLHRRVDARALGGRELPYLLGFRSERGRNYARAFEELRAELARPAARAHEEVAVTFITHAECRVPVDTVESLARLASLYGVFVLPSRPLDLPYLPLLRGHQVVTVESLAEREAQRRRALEVVNAVVGAGPGGAAARSP
jgi:hypothetical protein